MVQKIREQTIAQVALQLIVIGVFGVAPWILIASTGINENEGNGVVGGLLLLPSMLLTIAILFYSMRMGKKRKKLNLFYRVTAFLPLIALIVVMFVIH